MRHTSHFTCDEMNEPGAAMLEALEYLDLAVLAIASALLSFAIWKFVFTSWRCVSLSQNAIERRLVFLGVFTTGLATTNLVVRALLRGVKPSPVELLVYIMPSILCAIVYAVATRRGRPVVEALVALYLGIQLAIGMSGYGFYFLPGAVFMLAACATSLFRGQPKQTSSSKQ